MSDSAPVAQPCPDDILAQCAALMAEQGYHGTSMRDLARTTGRSIAGLYHYFSGKEELLYLINERGFAPLLANAKAGQEQYAQALQASKSVRRASSEFLCNLIGEHMAYFGSHLSEMRVLMLGTQPMSSHHGKAIRELKDRYTAIVCHAVREYVEARGQKITEAEAERKTYLLFGMMNWIFGWYSFDQHGPVDALAEEVFLTFTKGCASARGTKKGE